MIIDFNTVAFGRKLHDLRQKRDITSVKLSQLCNLHPVFVRQIESAARLPSLPVFVQLCNKLGASPNYFLSDSLMSNKEDTISNLNSMLLTLPPDKFDLVFKMIWVMINELSEDVMVY